MSWRAWTVLLLALFRFDYTWSAEIPLKCYQCNVERNDLCTDDYLTLCPAGQAFDRCMTTVSYTRAAGYEIRKSCALAPCNLRDRTATSGLGLDSCDRSNDEFLCVACCRGDGCNKDGAPATAPHRALMAASLLLLLVLAAAPAHLSLH